MYALAGSCRYYIEAGANCLFRYNEVRERLSKTRKRIEVAQATVIDLYYSYVKGVQRRTSDVQRNIT